jgi:hypothetical protein
MAYLEQPLITWGCSAPPRFKAPHTNNHSSFKLSPPPQREVRKKGLAIRFFFKTIFKATPVTQIKVQTGLILFFTEPRPLISSVMPDPLAGWIA